MAKRTLTYDKIWHDWTQRFHGTYTEAEFKEIHRYWRSLGKRTAQGRL